MRDELETLIADLEKAQEGSRELSDRVLLANGWRVEDEMAVGYPDGKLRIWYTPMTQFQGVCPSPSTSLDAAFHLLPKGWRVHRINGYHTNDNRPWGWGVELRFENPEMGLAVGETQQYAGGLPLALCAAICRARLMESDR